MSETGGIVGGAEGKAAPIRVLLVDDHASLRESLAFMMNREPDIEVVGDADTIEEARPLLPQAHVVLMDLDLPDGNGIQLIQAMRTSNPEGLALVLTASASRVEAAKAVDAGAAAVIHKSERPAAVIEAVRRLARGDALMSTRETIDLLRLASIHREQNREAMRRLASLTPREREVLAGLGDGLTDREIAERLETSTETIRTHMVRILSKLDVNSRLQALVFAVRYGAVEIK